MKSLIVEDDFISRRLLQKILEDFGSCDIAVNGEEAIEAFILANNEKAPYDLICIDIMLPGMNGQEILKKIREIEEKEEIMGLDGVKILMVTALSDKDNIINAFKSGCEAYIVKPIEKSKIVEEIKKLELI